MKTCILCNFEDDDYGRKVFENEHVIVIEQYAKMTMGKALVVPKRHVISPFDLNENEWSSLYYTFLFAKSIIDLRYHPAGYTLGCNVGKVAGQTMEHAHFHIYPRFEDGKNVGKSIGQLIRS